MCLDTKVETEVRNQVAREMRGGAQLNDAIWWNKHTRTETKARIYKNAIINFCSRNLTRNI